MGCRVHPGWRLEAPGDRWGTVAGSPAAKLPRLKTGRKTRLPGGYVRGNEAAGAPSAVQGLQGSVRAPPDGGRRPGCPSPRIDVSEVTFLGDRSRHRILRGRAPDRAVPGRARGHGGRPVARQSVLRLWDGRGWPAGVGSDESA